MTRLAVSQVRGVNCDSAHLLFVPERSHAIEVFLEEEGAHGKVIPGRFMWQMLPMDHALLK